MNNTITEHEEAIILAEWLELKGIMYTKIPNETYTTSWNQKRKNKIEGVKKGLCDYLVLLPNKCLIFIELKRVKGGKVSPEQQVWIDNLNTIENVGAYVCYGAEESIKTIKQFL